MPSADLEKLTGIASRFGAFVAERYPFAVSIALEALAAAMRGREPRDEAGIEKLRTTLRRELGTRLEAEPLPAGLAETTPRTSSDTRLEQARAELVNACDGFLRRAAIRASLTREEKRELLAGMLLTRATDT